MIRQGACMHASTFEVCFIYHQGLSVIAQEALTVGGGKQPRQKLRKKVIN